MSGWPPCTARTWWNGQGELIAGLVVLVDVTERKRSEEIMIQTEKMMSVGGLAAGMAHEINNPLGSILGGRAELPAAHLA